MVWLSLAIGLATAGGWLYTSWEAKPPPPGPAEVRVSDVEMASYRVTKAIPAFNPISPNAALASETTQPIPQPSEQAPATTTPKEPAAESAGPAAVSGQIPAPPATGEIKETLVPEAVPTTTLPVPTTSLPPPREVSSGQVLPLEELKRPIKVNGLIIPPPEAIPPFSPKEKPVFVLETERQDRMITVKGTTNLAVQGNGVQVSLFRSYREAGDETERRAELHRRNLPLVFEGQFPIEDSQWFQAWAERAAAQPGIYPQISSLDQDRVFVEVLFTAKRADLGDLPGLSVYPIEETNLQVYRFIRPVVLPLDQTAKAILAGEKVELAPSPPRLAEEIKPAPTAELAEPAKPAEPTTKGPTKVIILPLRFLDGPLPGDEA